ncbi:hypothetical protein Ptr902_01550 [Pyrenophora tritici-repentis]|uniref:Uncharacterized protein n=1 Tax=Pyrenophora tritici-repentis TaxID=45151 RepID=A0A5M9LNZ0_9PLEO|nr:hypothetical protein PtrV1_01346 [Pyrenophora tritici-repentis]KAF7454082.1 hypothetical protein A1F99_013400 [Pyrenophora tritici-repentis]KAF7577172.1 hypothetical protein PtrM4_014120 [Pyrenophora tritici-repentis]KAI0569968.1 hypothetical protein Alg215_11340 [Pyrenophora tritici-repentis]KAI0578764.1 hypothetical protein Alg130_07802 [Pyrenophora tritici-repentis]
MRLIIASPAIFALALASSPIKPRQSPDPVHTVDACCGPPAPGPVGAPANWCQDRWGKNTYCCVEPENQRCPTPGFPNPGRIYLHRGRTLQESNGTPCAGGVPGYTGKSGCFLPGSGF